MESDLALEVRNQKAMVPEGQKTLKSIGMESTKHMLKLVSEISEIKYIAHIKVVREYNIYPKINNFLFVAYTHVQRLVIYIFPQFFHRQPRLSKHA